MIRLLKFLIGILLLPFCHAMTLAVYRLYQLTEASGIPAPELQSYAVPIGFILWTLLFFLLPRPIRTYVLAHELTHALWALSMGARVGKMRIGKNGGHVELSKSNFIITLAPYFFPLYSVLVIAIYYLAGIWFHVELYNAWWLGAIGFTWAFHITFTIQMLTEQQPDIQEHGRLFSYVLIYSMNLLVMGVWMAAIGTPKFFELFHHIGTASVHAYTTAFSGIQNAWSWIMH